MKRAQSLILRKDHIIYTTIDVLNEYGIQGLSTKEIAKREGITEAAIFKHYPKKNDLMLAVLNYYSQYDNDVFETIKSKALGPIEAIYFLLETYATYYQNYPAITFLSQAIEELRYNEALEEKVIEILTNRLERLNGLLAEGKRLGSIQSEIDISTVATIIYGSYNFTILKWRVQKFSFDLKTEIIKSLNIILNNVFVK